MKNKLNLNKNTEYSSTKEELNSQHRALTKADFSLSWQKILILSLIAMISAAILERYLCPITPILPINFFYFI